jgi:hypothetical protein
MQRIKGSLLNHYFKEVLMGRWVKRIVLGVGILLVRFGATSDKSAWSDDAFVADVLKALPH